MSELLNCPNGHQWRPVADESGATAGQGGVCPVCGASIELVATPSRTAQLRAEDALRPLPSPAPAAVAELAAPRLPLREPPQEPTLPVVAAAPRSLDPRVSQLFQRWLALYRQGQVLSAEALCAEELPDAHPELVQELRQRIGAWERQKPLADQARNQAATVRESGLTGQRFESTWSQAEHTDGAPTVDEVIFSVSQYDSFQFLARGGLGEVYRAGDRALGREVALKFIRRDVETDSQQKTQFQVEGEVTARLEHPGVVPVYGLGCTSDGRLFQAMRFIRGETLGDKIDGLYRSEKQGAERSELAVEFRNLLSRFVSVCNTIAYAHNRGILHRDIKPDNIMLGKYGETLVVDWGLACSVTRDEHARASGEKALTPASGDSGREAAGQVAGTPCFMSPEQAVGTAELTRASDIYSLGATLYKLLTGEPAIQGWHLREILENVAAGKFRRPREVNKRVPPALEAICLQAMQRDPHARYATALDLAADIERWLADEPVSVYRQPWSEKLVRFGRRHRSGAISAVLALLAVIGVVSVAAVLLGRMAQRERQARLVAEEAREERLVANARLAAEMFAKEIDLRWQILEREAADADLRQWLQQANAAGQPIRVGDALQTNLQNRLAALHVGCLEATWATSWLVTDRHGTLLARSPLKDNASELIGRSFGYRDYFHGLGRDLEPSQAEDVQPLRDVHRSCVFRSQSNDKLMVAFTVPVWSSGPGTDDRRVLGVLGMAVEVARFASLQSGLSKNLVLVLVDVRDNWLENKCWKGLILHHPRLVEMSVGRGLPPPSQLLYCLDEQRVAALQRLRDSRLLQGQPLPTPNGSWARQAEQPGASLQESLVRDFCDPLDQGRPHRWFAAFEPVLVKGREDAVKNTGLFVIVQEACSYESR